MTCWQLSWQGRDWFTWAAMSIARLRCKPDFRRGVCSHN